MQHANTKLKQDVTNIILNKFNKGVGVGTSIVLILVKCFNVSLHKEIITAELLFKERENCYQTNFHEIYYYLEILKY